MKTLLSIAAYAGLFYLMMRFGCGSHMFHRHVGHNSGAPKAKLPGNPVEESVDPVCKMHVRSGQGYTKNQEGRAIRFCSRDCLDKFEAEPQRYL